MPSSFACNALTTINMPALGHVVVAHNYPTSIAYNPYYVNSCTKLAHATNYLDPLNRGSNH